MAALTCSLEVKGLLVKTVLCSAGRTWSHDLLAFCAVPLMNTLDLRGIWDRSSFKAFSISARSTEPLSYVGLGSLRSGGSWNGTVALAVVFVRIWVEARKRRAAFLETAGLNRRREVDIVCVGVVMEHCTQR